MSQPLLQVENLTTEFQVQGEWLPVVQDLSFSLDRGETLALVGESGSGKSVTAMSLMRLLPAMQSRIRGRVQFAGQDLLALNGQQMRAIRGNSIGMVFQEPMTSLNPVMKIGRQITEVLQRHRGMSGGAARAEALRLLEQVRIPAARARLDDYPLSFSGGMRQRVVIAIALACQPDLLIADEPTTALDVTIQAGILDLLKTLQAENGMAMLFITHDMGVVAGMADRTLVMYQGKAVEQRATRELFAQPQHAYSQRLLAAVPLLGAMKGIALPQPFPLADGGASQAEDALANAPQQGASVLEVNGLVQRFAVRSGWLRRVTGQVHAVENVSLSIRPGETLALVGESGSGKSTTGRAILRFSQPQRGEITLCGEDMRLARPDRLAQLRTRAQMIFQDPYESLNPRMRVGEAIAEPLISHGLFNKSTVGAEVDRLLTRVGLRADMATRFPHQFSGGQRQRLCIARALALNPALIIADEAVSALDVTVKAQIINLMLELQRDTGLAYLFISHDMAVVERISHRVAVMYQGEIVEIGSRADIFENPQHPYTRRLLSAVPVPDPTQPRPQVELVADLSGPLKPLDYQSPERQYRQISQQHFVQIATET
ncbi:glutathione ABC transporter ATP-binding protein GsiA [Izhakiella australiensis]|uniref:Glutathione import ATP-binding protein GsiA n=1 Tax=Izhakiella australiensis TaxID=1926881 RepID=A0A1S8YKV6_9GAMM|nr:ABC transporter ATP-binding protein [Izhakiella australiensis]OON39366.1 glutathione ABC transporter ATP-binding protein GsiA [Izhakiella australiensis]